MTRQSPGDWFHSLRLPRYARNDGVSCVISSSLNLSMVKTQGCQNDSIYLIFSESSVANISFLGAFASLREKLPFIDRNQTRSQPTKNLLFAVKYTDL